MDRPPSPTVSPTSSGDVVQVTTQTQQQPTYTTAGTIYNPNAAAPLQPPTRRGRTFKWSATGSSQTEIPLFPRSLTSILPTTHYGVRGPLQMSIQQQYSPLQQNYDRAVNPLNRMDEYPEEMRVTIDSRQQSGAASAPLPVTSPKPKCDRDHLHSDEEDEADEAIQKTLLTTMTVKSLQNLASYPNPNQKDAQKALSRGSRPKSSLSSQPAASASTSTSQDKTVPRTLGSPIQIRENPDPNRNRLREFYEFTQRLEAHKKQMREKQEQRERRERGESTPEQSSATDLSECPSFRLPSPASSLKSEPHGPTLIPSGHGAIPKPLTAGPPGQRQLRSSTFEATFKALYNNSRTSYYRGDEDQILSSTQQAQSHMGLEDVPATTEACSSIPAYEDYATASANYYAQMYYYAAAQAQVYRYASAKAAGQYSVVGQSEPTQTLPPGADSFKYQDWRADGPFHADPNWRDPEPSTRLRFQPGTDRLNDDELQARTDKINKFWYSGVNMLEQRMDATLGTEQLKNYGAIGEEVVYHGARMMEYPHMDIGEVNGTEAGEHSDYLLQIACENVSRVIEEMEKAADDGRAEVLSQVESLTGYPPVDSYMWAQ